MFLQYGQTETFRGTFLPPEDVDVRPTSMGRAIPGVEILVLRDDGSPCDPGEVGELVQRGPTLAAGYWNDPAATEATFRPCPCRPFGTPAGERAVFSGDMVKRDEHGFLYFVSRRDRLIKTLGFRVGPDEISDVLFASGEINECVVTTEADTQRGERIVAFVTLSPGGSLGALSHFIRSELPRHMQPARVQVLDVIPRMPSGKYDLAALRAGAVPA
jgi:acyl-coenzyme A synthetase/AMP-(fatty) acid ligase